VTAAVRLAMWSGPRNISTALMRSWENRPDSRVVDEPLYAHYLDVTGLDHPGRAEIIASGQTDWRVVVEELLGPLPGGVAVFYQKQMTHHLTPDIERSWIGDLTNVLLIREPREVVASYLRSRSQITPDDIGVGQQDQLYDELAARGAPPLVIDSRDFLSAPAAYLEVLCDLAGVAFSDSMLSWPPGPRDTDGVWAPYWYEAVERSTGFGPPPDPPAVDLPAGGAEVAEACTPAYQRLRERRLVIG
jgi:hypothetical protein